MIKLCRSALLFSVGLAVLGATVASACTAAGTPVEATRVPSAPAAAPVNAWDELVRAAQQEGTLNIYGSEIAPAVAPIREAFRQKFGITIEAVFGRPPEVLAKITAERRAGLYLADVGHLGETTQIKDVKPLGVTVPLSGLLVSPEVTNPERWMRGRLPFVDEDNHVLVFMAMATPGIMVNTDVVKESDIASFLDIVKPQWKGKIVLSDPRVSGPAPNQMANMVRVYGRERAIELFKQLAALDPMITRDVRLLTEWVARGKYPVSYGASPTAYGEFKNAGAPIRFAAVKEPTYFTGGPGNISVFSNNPHPKATQLYINWILGKEGSTIWSKSTGYPSGRADVSKEGMDPSFVPRGDETFPDLETLDLRLEIRNIAAEIFRGS